MASRKRSGPPSELGQPYAPGDRIPTPDAVEKDTDSAWAMWSDVQASHEAKFADTTPESRPMKLGNGPDQRYAVTQPSPLVGGAAPREAPAAKKITADDVMVEARRNNRVCPKPERWQQLFEMLPDKLPKQPSAPLTGAAWTSTPSLSKRMSLREHIEWAETHGVLDQVFAFLKQLPENEWHHMGD